MEQALASWSKVRGIGSAHLIFRVEPGNPDMLKLCGQAADFAGQVDVIENFEKYGELGNPWHAIDTAFGYTDFVIYAEDDDLVSSDILEYFAWCRDRFRERPEVLSVSAFRHHAGTLEPAEVELSGAFTSWVFGFWHDRWQKHLRDDWDFDYRHRGWDWRIIDYWLGERNMKTVLPGRSRSQHIGIEGVHFRPGDYERLRSECFEEYQPVQQYREAT